VEADGLGRDVESASVHPSKPFLLSKVEEDCKPKEKKGGEGDFPAREEAAGEE